MFSKTCISIFVVFLCVFTTLVQCNNSHNNHEQSFVDENVNFDRIKSTPLDENSKDPKKMQIVYIKVSVCSLDEF